MRAFVCVRFALRVFVRAYVFSGKGWIVGACSTVLAGVWLIGQQAVALRRGRAIPNLHGSGDVVESLGFTIVQTLPIDGGLALLFFGAALNELFVRCKMDKRATCTYLIAFCDERAVGRSSSFG